MGTRSPRTITQEFLNILADQSQKSLVASMVQDEVRGLGVLVGVR